MFNGFYFWKLSLETDKYNEFVSFIQQCNVVQIRFSKSQSCQKPEHATSTPKKTDDAKKWSLGKWLYTVEWDKKLHEFSLICRSDKKPKMEMIKVELEMINSFLTATDDSSHGLEMAGIESKGSGSAKDLETC